MPDPTPRKRFFVGFSPGYAQMSDEEKNEACGEMADEIHRQLGIGKYAGRGEDDSSRQG